MRQKSGSKVKKVMGEFKSGKLKSSSGDKVTNPKQAVAIALSEAGLSKKTTGGHMAKSKKLFGGKETYGEELAEAKSVKSGKTSTSEFVKSEKAEGHEGEELKSLSKQAKDIKSGKVSAEDYAKMESSETDGKRGGGAIMASKKSTMGEALKEGGDSKRGGGAIMASKRSTMGAALKEGGYADVKGTGVAVKGFRPAKMS
jgi:hypothetical protein